MRIRLVLMLIPALALLGATCVTSARQRGPMGPWVGEVVNTGDMPMREVMVTARVQDAAGRDFGIFTVPACPSALLPGQRGSFELFFPTDIALDVTPPLRAEFAPVTSGFAIEYPLPSDMTGDGLAARSVGTYPDKRAAMAEVRNDSAVTFSQIKVCATIRTPGGTLAEVGSADLFPSALRPGETATVPVFFNTMPDGVIDVVARGVSGCCSAPLQFDRSEFVIETTRVVTIGGYRSLVVTGEMRNRAGQDLAGLRLAAYLTGSPVTRVSADLGCGGTVGAGGAAVAEFAIPIDSSEAAPVPAIVGIEAWPWQTGYRIPVSGIASTPLAVPISGLDTVEVTASLHNSTSKWLYYVRACGTLRDRQGHVAGVGPMFQRPSPGYNAIAPIPPGGTVEVTGSTSVLGDVASTTVDAYGEPQDQGPINMPGSP